MGTYQPAPLPAIIQSLSVGLMIILEDLGRGVSDTDGPIGEGIGRQQCDEGREEGGESLGLADTL